MPEAILKRYDFRADWGPIVAGTLIAVALTAVLELFGLALGTAGYVIIMYVFMGVVPIVSTFVGAAVAADLCERKGAYLNGALVWCLSLLGNGLILVFALQRMAALNDVAVLALAGLAALLSFAAALLGSAVGIGLSKAVAAGRSRTSAVTTRTQEEEYAGKAPIPPSSSEHPELRH